MADKLDGRDENGDVKQASLEDSNMSNYGGKEMRDLRKSAAASDKAFAGAGQKVGLEIWRVENKRTKADTPDFGVARWPKDQYGSFFSGDSYLLLNTYQVIDPETKKPTDKLGWDVHFWIGKESTQDEYGVAAYKAVELDDLLDDGPVQHREEQYHESALFQSYFKNLIYMEGGIASGFRQVKPEEYVPRLFQVRRTKKTVRAFEVPVKATSLNKGDTFVLDCGTKVYLFVGESSNAFEKMKGGAMANSIVSARMGKAKMENSLDDKFWSTLQGSEADVQEAQEHEENEEDKDVDPEHLKLFRLSDASGKLTFKLEKEGALNQGMLDSNDAFIIDAKIEIFVWVGKKASESEKQHCMKYAMDYLKEQGLPSTTPVTRIKDGQVHHVFGGIVPPVGAKLPIKKTTPSKSPAAAAPATTPKEPAFAKVGLRSTGADKTGNTPPAKESSSAASSTPAFAKVGLKPAGSANSAASNGTDEKPKPFAGLRSSGGPKLW